MQPTLRTPRLSLRPARSDDVDALHSLWSDIDVRRYLFDDREIARDVAWEVLEPCLALAGRGLGLWILERSDDGATPPTAIGCAGLLPVTESAKFEPRIEGMIEPLVALRPSEWRRGYAVEALLALQRHAAETLALSQLAGVADIPNEASNRMLCRAGFQPFADTDGPRHRMRIYRWEAGTVTNRSEGDSMDFDVPNAMAVLERTPRALRAMLDGLSARWTEATEGGESWSPYVILGHLIHGERTDWIARARIILEQGVDRRFTPYDRFAQFTESQGYTLDELLDEFSRLREENLVVLSGWNLTESQLSLTGEHPEFGTVTLRQLLATWVAHDLGHIAQTARVMAKQYREAVGPWTAYLPILTR